MLDKNELYNMLLEMQDYVFSKELRDACNELSNTKESMKQEFYKNVSAPRGIYTPLPITVLITNDKLGRKVKKKETILREGNCFYLDDTGIRMAELYGCGRKYPLSTEYIFRNDVEEFFFRKDFSGDISYFGKVWTEEDCSISVLASPMDGKRPFPNAGKNDEFFLDIEIRKFKKNTLSECQCVFDKSFKKNELSFNEYGFIYDDNGELMSYYIKDEPEYANEISDKHREWIKSRGGISKVMYL